MTKTLPDHPLVLPPRGATNLVKLGPRGSWSDPRSKAAVVPARAYLGKLGDQAFVWVAHCKCASDVTCPIMDGLEEAGQIWEAVSVQRRPAATVKRAAKLKKLTKKKAKKR